MSWFWNTFFNNRAGAWTALFTAVLSVFTWMLYRVADRTDQTGRATERAFVSFSGLGLGVRMNNSDTPPQWVGQQIFINVANSGNTPARTVIIKTNMKDWPEDLPEDYQFPLQGKTEATVAPKGNYATDVTVPAQALEQNWHGKAHIFIWGSVLYRDIFPDEPDHLTEFCAEMTHVTLGWASNAAKHAGVGPINFYDPDAAMVTFQFQGCKQHNCYDKDCKDYSDRVKDMRQ